MQSATRTYTRLVQKGYPVSTSSKTILPISTRFNTRKMSTTVDANVVREITQKGKEITGQARPVQGGAAAAAQKATGSELTGKVVSEIGKGESKITGDSVHASGPAATAQSILSSGNTQASNNSTAESATGVLDASTISKVTDAEKSITGQDYPVKSGPTAQAQSHAQDPINSDTLSAVTEGEKKITGGERVKGGPTSTLQSELAKSRQE